MARAADRPGEEVEMLSYTLRASSLVLLAVAVGVGCAAPSGQAPEPAAKAEPAAPPAGGPPTTEELGNATYHGLESPDGEFTLADGRWEGEPFDEGGASRPVVSLGRDFRILGDLDGDGSQEAVVLLAQSSGGSGTFDYIAVVDRAGDGAVVNVATVPLGDRVQIRRAGIEDGRLVVDAVRAGPEDAACCPGEMVRWTWVLSDGRLEEVGSEITGRLSLDALAGREWVLRMWSWDEPAPADPEVVLSYLDGRLAGSSGCNRFSAAVSAGASPGDVSLGPAMGTRMACPEPAASVEDRFLAQLGGVTKYGFLLGRLALSYQIGDDAGVMLFDSRPPAGESS
jgi:heat shock protein HslJ